MVARISLLKSILANRDEKTLLEREREEHKIKSLYFGNKNKYIYKNILYYIVDFGTRCALLSKINTNHYQSNSLLGPVTIVK